MDKHEFKWIRQKTEKSIKSENLLLTCITKYKLWKNRHKHIKKWKNLRFNWSKKRSKRPQDTVHGVGREWVGRELLGGRVSGRWWKWRRAGAWKVKAVWEGCEEDFMAMYRSRQGVRTVSGVWEKFGGGRTGSEEGMRVKEERRDEGRRRAGREGGKCDGRGEGVERL